MTTPLDAAAKALVAAEKYAADLVAERDALLARVNELDDEVARLAGELEKANYTARDYMRQRDIVRAEVERMRDVVEASRSASAPSIGGAPLAATAMALELVADVTEQHSECQRDFIEGLRAKARELLEGK